MSNDLTIVLQAAARLPKASPIAVVLLGDGKEKSALVAQATEMGLDNVHFIPPVAKQEMVQALAAADACLAILKPIELYKTVYPNKVFDYMAAGRPVILAIDGVIRDVIESAGAGVFVPPGNPQALAEAIRGLSSQPERCKEMGVAGPPDNRNQLQPRRHGKQIGRDPRGVSSQRQTKQPFALAPLPQPASCSSRATAQRRQRRPAASPGYHRLQNPHRWR